jgi:oxygen-dependent protoporphyrinogen oxidase
MAARSVIVIGAGIAGLTAAYQLRKAGLDVLVLDRNDYVGGRMAHVEWEGFRLEIGAKFVTTADRTLLDLVREVGLGDQMVKAEEGLTTIIYRNGKLHAANFLSIPSYFRWGGLSLEARLAMFKLLPYFLRLGRLKNPYHLERSAMPDVDETFERFFKEKINAEMFEYWVIPMFETMCTYTGEDLSRKAFLAMMVAYLNADSVRFRDGIGLLPQALARYVEVELNARVQQIRSNQDSSGVHVEYAVQGRKKSVSADRLVVAVQGNRVLPLFATPREAWKQFFPKVGYSTGALHYHIAETDFQPAVKGTFVPRASKLPICSVSFPDRREGCLLMMTDPSVYSFRMEQDPDELARQARDVACLIFPELQGTFRGHRVFKWREKVPAFRPGYLDALQRFWADPQEGPAYFCGDYFAGPSTGGALFSGMECSQRLLASI